MARNRKAIGGDIRRGGPGDEPVYAEIYEAILDHRLMPGTKLTEDALSDIFGVSRTIVRKALFRLGHENIVRLRPNRGAAVASPTIEEARQVFAARRVVEAAVVRAVAAKANAAQLDALRALAGKERASFDSGDRRGWIRLSGDFHLRLAEIGGNAVLSAFLKELVSRTSLIIALYQAPGGAACSSDEHAALIDAIESGDAGRAEALMEDHLRAIEDKLSLVEPAAPVDLARAFAGASPRSQKM